MTAALIIVSRKLREIVLHKKEKIPIILLTDKKEQPFECRCNVEL